MRIFLSYRKQTSAAEVRLLFKELSGEFGAENVFFDIDSIRLGSDFREKITFEVTRCDVLIVLISKEWNRLTNAKGLPRLADPNDFVRIEVESALERDIPVIPMALDGAAFPTEEELPESLAALAWRQGLEVEAESFDADIERLKRELRRMTDTAGGREPSPDPPKPLDSPKPPPPRSAIAERAPFRDLPEGPELLEVDFSGLDGQDSGPLAIGRFPVLLSEFRAFVQASGHQMESGLWSFEGLLQRSWKLRPKRSFLSPGFRVSDRHPVVGVNLDDAQRYAAWLSAETGQSYRLLSRREAWIAIGQWRQKPSGLCREWEDLDPLQGVPPADAFVAGGAGFFKQDGYLWEWRRDSWDGAGPDAAAPADWRSGVEKLRKLENGALDVYPEGLPDACRAWSSAAHRVSIIGFRVAREVAPAVSR